MTNLFKWFTGLDIQAKIIMAFVGLALVGIALATMFHVIDTLKESATETGVVTERAATQGRVIENVQAATETRAAVSDPRSCAAYVECMQSARTTANCVRYLPHDEGCAVPASAGTARR